MEDKNAAYEPPDQSPFFRALQADRYERQRLIRQYEQRYSRRLLVYAGYISPQIIPPLADGIGDISRSVPLDLMLSSLGGDGETALRMARMCHEGRDEFRVIVANRAKSAATLLALAADTILMSDTSDLGPVDPQVWVKSRDEYVPALDIKFIYEEYEQKVLSNPQAAPWYAGLMGDIDAVIYQRAEADWNRTDELVDEALSIRVVPTSESEVVRITEALKTGAPTHSAAVGHARASELGLPVEYRTPDNPEWNELWRLYMHYHVMTAANVIEGRKISFVYTDIT